MDSAEQRIIEAAIATIEEFGFHQVTVRRIAAKAGVNIASISYYFRSKEQLLDKVLNMMVDNAFDWEELSYTDNLPPREQLYAVMDHLTKGAQSLPEVTRAYFYEALVNGNYETRTVHEINRFIETLLRKINEKGISMNEKDLRTSITQVFMTGLLCVGVVTNVYASFLQADLTKDSERKKFLKHLIDRLIDE